MSTIQNGVKHASDLELRAADVLASLGAVKYIGDFGQALLDQGVMQTRRCNHGTRQGAALLAGKWLKRLERRGLAVLTHNGWVARRPTKS